MERYMNKINDKYIDDIDMKDIDYITVAYMGVLDQYVKLISEENIDRKTLDDFNYISHVIEDKVLPYINKLSDVKDCSSSWIQIMPLDKAVNDKDYLNAIYKVMKVSVNEEEMITLENYFNNMDYRTFDTLFNIIEDFGDFGFSNHIDDVFRDSIMINSDGYAYMETKALDDILNTRKNIAFGRCKLSEIPDIEDSYIVPAIMQGFINGYIDNVHIDDSKAVWIDDVINDEIKEVVSEDVYYTTRDKKAFDVDDYNDYSADIVSKAFDEMNIPREYARVYMDCGNGIVWLPVLSALDEDEFHEMITEHRADDYTSRQTAYYTFEELQNFLSNSGVLIPYNYKDETGWNTDYYPFRYVDIDDALTSYYTKEFKEYEVNNEDYEVGA